jgi:hypothetical protein
MYETRAVLEVVSDRYPYHEKNVIKIGSNSVRIFDFREVFYS